MGWNSDVFVILSAEDKLSSEDVKTTLNRDKSNSILSNEDFHKFQKNLTTVNLWIKSDKFASELKKEDQFEEFTKENGFNWNDNYFHLHFTFNKDNLKMELNVNRNETFKNVDQVKVIKAFNRISKRRYNYYYNYEDAY